GHISAKGNRMATFCAQKSSNLTSRVCDQPISFTGCDKLSVCIGIMLGIYFNNGIDYLLRHLSSARSVQKYNRTAIDHPLKCRKLIAYGLVHFIPVILC